jgi:hypothetical protein
MDKIATIAYVLAILLFIQLIILTRFYFCFLTKKGD